MKRDLKKSSTSITCDLCHPLCMTVFIFCFISDWPLLSVPAVPMYNTWSWCQCSKHIHHFLVLVISPLLNLHVWESVFSWEVRLFIKKNQNQNSDNSNIQMMFWKFNASEENSRKEISLKNVQMQQPCKVSMSIIFWCFQRFKSTTTRRRCKRIHFLEVSRFLYMH